jgi:hypothetical protein
MKRKEKKKNYPDLDRFDRKQKKRSGSKNKGSKRKLSIYDEFSDEELDDYNSSFYKDDE